MNKILKYLKENLSKSERQEFINAFDKMVGSDDLVVSYENGKITVRTK
jgi:hypothetical protein